MGTEFQFGRGEVLQALLHNNVNTLSTTEWDALKDNYNGKLNMWFLPQVKTKTRNNLRACQKNTEASLKALPLAKPRPTGASA